VKIAIIVDKCAPFFTGGYENRYWNIATRLAVDHDVRVFTSLHQNSLTLSRVQFIRSNLPGSRRTTDVDRSLWHSAAFAVQLVRSPFDQWLPDVVIVESIPFIHLAPMSRWIRNSGSLIVLNVNEAWFEYPYFPGLLSTPSRLAIRHLLHTGLAFSDLIITISRPTAESLRTNYGVRDVTVVPMGVDITQLPDCRPGPQDNRRLDFVTVGRVVPIKRQLDLLRALALLRDRYQWNGRAAIVGDGPLMPKLERASRELSLDANLTFFGKLSDKDKFRVLRDSRTFVLCSEREGFSLSTLEAQACGVAVVVAKPRGKDVFGVSDLVKDGETGLLYRAGSVDELARGLARLERDEALRSRLASNGWQQSMSYDWNRIVRNFEQLLIARWSNSTRRP
jgi:glycosyltransferase involved in cell wall biosynthesis